MADVLPQYPLRVRFNPLIRPYLVATIGLTMAVTIVGIPLAVVWVLGVGQWWARHYYDKLECELGERTLRYRKGILFQVEKTIPLENIQDVTFIEGPLLRRFHLSVLKFETAGQSAGQAHDMRLIGIIDAHEFRNQILAARQRLRHPGVAQPAPASAGGGAPELTAALQGMQRSLDEVVTLLRESVRRQPPA